MSKKIGFISSHPYKLNIISAVPIGVAFALLYHMDIRDKKSTLQICHFHCVALSIKWYGNIPNTKLLTHGFMP